ncbi:MAG: hypothetical protein JW797_11730 [Bradymonadales bacterium]|nr:hypothetical protein [Bradymonadales bacterium]
MLESLINALNASQSFEGATEKRRYYGLYTGTVTNNKDPDGQYRVQVTLPHLHEADKHATFWARITTLMAGNDMGFFCLPEVDDEVAVAFVAGDDQQPVVIGSLWNAKDKTVCDNNGQDGKNDRRWWKTRSGHILEFNDKDGEQFVQVKTQSGHIFEMHDKGGEEYIHLIDKSGNNFLTIDTANMQIDLEADSGGKINVTTADGTVTVDCKDFIVKASGDIKMTADGDVKVESSGKSQFKSGGDTKIEAGGNIVEKGSQIKLN